MIEIGIIQHRIRAALSTGETLAGLARKAELHRNTLYGCTEEGWNPSYETVRRLSAHLPEVSA